MENDDKKGILFGIIGILTLIMAIIGASLAYFSINTKSSNDALSVQAAQVKIVYTDGNKLNISKIIPSRQEVVEMAFKRTIKDENITNKDKCIDDNNQVICGMYEFSVTNNGVGDIAINTKIIPNDFSNDNEIIKFKNLKFRIFNITNENILKDNFGIELTNDNNFVKYENFNLFSDSKEEILKVEETKKYRLILWLDETEKNQDDEQAAIFKGEINIDVTGKNANTIDITN